MSLVDTLIIVTNALVVVSSVALAFITFVDVNKEEQVTLREVVLASLKGKAHEVAAAKHDEKRGVGDVA
jgi:hypothetical protein